MDLWTELLELANALDEAIRDMRKTGRELAEAERDYKVCLRSYALRLKGMKGFAVGLIQLVVKGEPEVADARMRRDIAQTMYDASREVVMATKLKLRVVNEQISREISNPHVGRGDL